MYQNHLSFFYKLYPFVFSIIFSILLYNSVYAQNSILIKKTENNIFVLDKYGDRYLLSKKNEIKIDDYLKSKDQPVLFKIKSDKICFSKNSSIKIKKIDQKNSSLSIELIQGAIFLNINDNSNTNYTLLINNLIIKNFSNYMYFQKKIHKPITIKSFESEALIIKKFSSKINLKRRSYYFFHSGIINFKINENKFVSYEFLDSCFNKKKILDAQKTSRYICVTKNGKMNCGYF